MYFSLPLLFNTKYKISTLFFLSIVFCSPILSIASYQLAEYIDGSEVAVCLTSVDTFWPAFFFVFSIILFFFLPLLILIVLYSIIAKHLMENPGIISHGYRNNVFRYRRQVIVMLGAVVLSFFACLLPFRALTLWIIVVPSETIMSLGIEGYYNLLYFSRIMHYLNSAMNPILYNLMSSKFRDGFLRLLGCRSIARNKLTAGTRKGTFHTTSTNLSSSSSDRKRETTRRCSVTKSASKISEDINSSSLNDGNTSVLGQPRISFEGCSSNIIKYVKAISLLQDSVIEETDETINSEQVSEQNQEGLVEHKVKDQEQYNDNQNIDHWYTKTMMLSNDNSNKKQCSSNSINTFVNKNYCKAEAVLSPLLRKNETDKTSSELKFKYDTQLKNNEIIFDFTILDKMKESLV